jgi:hypothetical protein
MRLLAFDVGVTQNLTVHLLAGSLPLTWEDQKADEGTHLLVLPSDQPSNRRDALAVQTFLFQLIQNPSQAFEM